MGAVEAGADAILVTCTSVNTVTKKIRDMIPVPVISVGEKPVAKKAVEAATKKIGILSSVPTSAEPVKQTILEMAKEAGKDLEVSIEVADGAFDALNAGDGASS